MGVCPRMSDVGSTAEEPMVCMTCMGLFLSSSRFGLFPVLCSERKGRSSSRRLRSGSRSDDELRQGLFALAWRLTVPSVEDPRELAIGASFDATNLYSVGPLRVLTMMQSYASAAKLRAVGPILSVGMSAVSCCGPHHLGSSVSSPAKASRECRRQQDVSLSAEGPFSLPGAGSHPPVARRW